MRWKPAHRLAGLPGDVPRPACQHLAVSSRDQVDGLSALAPVDPGEQPHTVLLTPGPYNETYFEHAYLARYLGFPLVEGQDLTVRGDTLYLKTLRGLEARPCRLAPAG